MTPALRLGALFTLVAGLAGLAPPAGADDAPALYARHCAQCHGADRLGLMGPALLPENLTRLKKSEAVEVVTAGRLPGSPHHTSRRFREACLSGPTRCGSQATGRTAT